MLSSKPNGGRLASTKFPFSYDDEVEKNNKKMLLVGIKDLDFDNVELGYDMRDSNVGDGANINVDIIGFVVGDGGSVDVDVMILFLVMVLVLVLVVLLLVMMSVGRPKKNRIREDGEDQLDTMRKRASTLRCNNYKHVRGGITKRRSNNSAMRDSRGGRGIIDDVDTSSLQPLTQKQVFLLQYLYSTISLK
ncbi:hypothetical protein POTOM_061828 [Populus tomentosa]|uniref:Uncharacterized protein n=1 Tax=Populus tomentosa TaxID=118781 RepID=A0A8X7XLS9_POPTO|nr:hypothetical protein POTOM_061828 [Populus tomentosa]